VTPGGAIITRRRRLPEELRKGGAWSGHADGKIAILAGADRTVATFGRQRIGLLVARQQQRNPRVGILRRRHKLTAADDETTEIVIIARVLKGDVTLAIHIPRITKLVGGIVLAIAGRAGRGSLRQAQRQQRGAQQDQAEQVKATKANPGCRHCETALSSKFMDERQRTNDQSLAPWSFVFRLWSFVT